MSTSLRELALLGTFLLWFFRSYPASFDRYPHSWTDGSIRVSSDGLFNLSKVTPNHQAGATGERRLKDGLSGPGGRVLTCKHPNTEQGSVSERHPWLWAGDGARKEILHGQKYTPCMWVCMLTYMWTLCTWHVCEHSRTRTCCWGRV